MFIEFEQRQKALDRVEQIFTRCLRKVNSLEMWRYYLNYIRRTHSPATAPAEKRAEARQIITQAFELVLANVGLDKEAGSLWAEYLAFLKASETTSMYEEQVKMDSQRKVFHRALVIPLSNIEAIWKDYDLFENGLNKLTAKKLLSEKSSGYMTARTAYREMKNLMATIDGSAKTWNAVPPSFNESECTLLEAWKKFIAWEKSNPLRIEDASAVAARVVYAFKSALSMLRFFPEIWNDAASYLVELGREEDAIAMLTEATEIMPRSLLLHFSLAEIKESAKKDFSEITSLFDALIANLETGINELNARFDEEKERLTAKLAAEAPKDTSEWDGEMRELDRGRQRQADAEIGKIDEAREQELMVARKGYSLAWIIYMRIARRCQGVKAARNVFKLARKAPHITTHVYVASALMEYYCSKQASVACNIFEAGVKAFANDAVLLGQYLEFLLQVNDDKNARALFERGLVALPPEQAQSLWSIFLKHEISYGELPNITKAEKRRREMYQQDGSSSQSVAERWMYLDLNNVAEQDLGLQSSSQSAATQKAKLHKRTASAGSNGSFPPSGAASVQPPPASVGLEFRAQSLESVHPERYPRPEFGKWVPYKPEPPKPVPLPLPSGEGLGPAGMPPIQPTVPTGGPANAPMHARAPLAPPMPIPSPTAVVRVPEQVAKLLEVLPPAATYNGPLVPIDDIIEIFRRLPVQIPPIPPLMVPVTVTLPASVGAGLSGAPWAGQGGGGPGFSSGDGRRDGGGRNRPPPRSGGGGGFKRKGGGRGSDDDDGGRYRGPGKRHR
ncbi:hypothetical protein DFJ73DRAFT_18216 [Zopfochytrium polystomum]|nr:hypothetical protein DFJ73DRAFT_18216 [Zopfochytrium polystomum]